MCVCARWLHVCLCLCAYICICMIVYMCLCMSGCLWGMCMHVYVSVVVCGGLSLQFIWNKVLIMDKVTKPLHPLSLGCLYCCGDTQNLHPESNPALLPVAVWQSAQTSLLSAFGPQQLPVWKRRLEQSSQWWRSKFCSVLPSAAHDFSRICFIFIYFNFPTSKMELVILSFFTGKWKISDIRNIFRSS